METHQHNDASAFQEPATTQQDIISSWLEFDLDLDHDLFQQDLENHLINLETDHPIPESEGSSSFMFDDDLYNNFNDQNFQLIHPVDEFLNNGSSEFELISSTDHLSPADSIINHGNTILISGLMKQPIVDVEMSEPMITTTNYAMESNKTTDDDDEDEDGSDDEDRSKAGSTLNSKNMVSERNRRKRLTKQLLSLRALVPNITKMDKRSVLVDALSYLRNILQETEELEKEMQEEQQISQDNLSDGTLGIPVTKPASVALSKSKAQITKIDTEKIDDKRFIVKITCKGGGGGDGVGSEVLRVFESLDFEITYTTLQQLKPQELLVTIFVRVRKPWKMMTEEKLKYSITSMALRIGLSLPN